MKKIVTMSLIAAAALGAAACTPKTETTNETTIVTNETTVDEGNLTTVDESNITVTNETANAM
ncbi:hypothetical protein [Sphingomonas immobilis]|uniref:Uncharacterized protein n=1 Tax=Sphingomonas immobilis TaxID=3063997 RepID=A0ABT9A0F5_9SPHN|nr:hypothetical protein [Sphingomonas sp. CA1-15]MDO7843316.1 hypothetical protein [Sphingomonas sp. CA1-15]